MNIVSVQTSWKTLGKHCRKLLSCENLKENRKINVNGLSIEFGDRDDTFLMCSVMRCTIWYHLYNSKNEIRNSVSVMDGQTILCPTVKNDSDIKAHVKAVN